jgi:hypothetical protein
MTDLLRPDGQYDLRAFFHAVGRFSGEKALTSTPPDRPEPEVPAELLDADNARVEADPLPVAAFVDGIQAALVVTHRAHRPVYLNFVASGAVGTSPRGGPLPLGVRERLTVVCSTLDREWVDEVRTGIPVEELPVETPPDIERAAVQILGGAREQLERRLVEDLVAQGHAPLALDGSLVGRPYQAELVGIVKSTGRKYLADESYLFRLPAGWRSPRFKIPAGSAGSGIDRYSCYLRMVNASQHAWNFGLIRLETFDPDLLAGRCLQERQNAASGDRRWDRHLAGVRAVEEFLRSRRPAAFAIGA